MTDTRALHLDAFDKSSTLILEPAPNGGWIVREKATDISYQNRLLGAFGNTPQMLEALAGALS